MSHGHHATTQYQPEPPDAWHAHTADEHPQAAHAENINGVQVVAYGIVAFILIAAATVATAVYFNWYKNRLEIALQERPDLVGDTTTQIQGEYLSKRQAIEGDLSRFGWANAAKGTVRVPLDRAMETVIANYQRTAKSAR